ncbi:(S)-N-methylcoclaurine 3'-hydroxylase isozyme 1 [Ziziphus jujuba]|uniref:(S)-N-methylcoclaurine 3'-hydroxylase isozyme 1 n=1 Tax=Ziziphus jujuba TaxID=326968 RepID=A0ABM3I2N5_ZIZJJ|nr:(S)-N-methylcoclaurine 3'-hydroxylase isozyme 1 [Ziziphus jujuba]
MIWIPVLLVLISKLQMVFMKIMSQALFVEKTNLLLILLILPFLFIILKLFKSSSISKSSSLPPGPFPWPIVGNIFQIGKEPHLAFTNLAKTYGPLFSLRLGNQLLIVGSSPDAAMEILKTQDRYLSGRYIPHVVPAKSLELNNFSLGWTLECNEHWRNLRTICRGELFSSKAIATQACIREKKVLEMLEFIGKMQGQVVKIRDLAHGVVYNMISNILISRDLINLEDESINGEMSRLVRNIMELSSTPNISDIYPILGPLDVQGLRKKSMELYDRGRKMWEAIIKERKEIRKFSDASTDQDFLDALINTGCPEVQVHMLLSELLTAGTDTSSSTIEWTLAELIRNPRCMKIVEEELAREISQDLVKESHLPNLTYLQACVKEAMRLHPSAPLLLPHRAVESCQVMTYTIPKDSMVLVNFWAISRDPDYWEDPLVFKPERFLNLSLDFKGNDFQLIPFGSGRRICPGLSMAAKHVPLVVASLIHSFNWSLPNGMDPRDLNMTERYNITMMKEKPLLLIPKTKF